MWPFFAWLAERKDAFGAIQAIVTTGAVLLGGAWAYVKFVQGRLFATRLEPTVGGRLCVHGGARFAVLTVTVRNVGLTKVAIDRDASGIEVSGYPAGNHFPEFHNAILDPLGTVRAIRSHDWIEPGECIVEELIVALPSEPLLALRLHLIVCQKPNGARTPVQWSAVGTIAANLEPRAGEVLEAKTPQRKKAQ